MKIEVIYHAVNPLEQVVSVSMPVSVVKALAAVLGPHSAGSLAETVKNSPECYEYLNTMPADWAYDVYCALDKVLEHYKLAF